MLGAALVLKELNGTITDTSSPHSSACKDD